MHTCRKQVPPMRASGVALSIVAVACVMLAPGCNPTTGRPQAKSRQRQQTRVPANTPSLPQPLFTRTGIVDISPDGSYVVSRAPLEGEPGDVEVWRLGARPEAARRIRSFRVTDPWQVRWHPTKKLVAVGSQVSRYQLLNVTTGEQSDIGDGIPGLGDVAWLDNSDEIAMYFHPAGEKKGGMRRVNVLTGRVRVFDTSWLKDEHSVGDIQSSRDGDYAISYTTFGTNGANGGGIALYPKGRSIHGRAFAGAIRDAVDPKSGRIVTAVFFLGWLGNGRLVYESGPPTTAVPPSTSGKRYEVWTCNKYGSDRRRWFVMEGAQPAQVSANSKRVVVYRDGTAMVYNTDELVKSLSRQPGPRK